MINCYWLSCCCAACAPAPIHSTFASDVSPLALQCPVYNPSSAMAGKRLAIDDDAASTTVKKARTSSADTSPSAPPAGVDLDTCRALVEAWMSINTYKDSKSVRDLKQGVEYSIIRMWKAEHDKFGPKLYVEVHFSEFETVPVMLPDRFVKLDNGAVQKYNTMIAAGFPPAIRYNGLIKDKAHDSGPSAKKINLLICRYPELV
ncbi:FAD-linked sulfhydryl oxidase ALR [Frankliniella fusca]|uniref:FAD-linked sulfhydryl oxidase ALR n=1 Tax=Frankliniella fusca TaxID=407009 RepID=A0AAE1HKC7_9NEOP|nr:FAD-linked sulfhydryl oxidase ALR [Frankliniella fusca]